MATIKTPEQLLDESRRDVMEYAYRDTDGHLYTIGADGERVRAAANAKPLSPEYQKIADQTAALILMQTKVLALNEAERGALATIINGQQQASAEVGSRVLEVWEELKQARKESGIPEMNLPGQGLANAIGKVADGWDVLPNLLVDTFVSGKEIFNQIGGGQISREDALAIGTAYASARQVAHEGRPTDPSTGEFFEGVFSKHFGSYLGAGIMWILDVALGFAENIPGIGDWIKKQGWHQDLNLAEHLEKSSRGEDNAQVAHEMGKLKTIGGQQTEEIAGLLTRGGVARTSSGGQIAVASATANQDAPAAVGEGAENLPTTPEAAAQKSKVEAKSLLGRVGDAVADSDFSTTQASVMNAGTAGTLGGSGLLGGLVYQTARGVAEGTARQTVASAEARAANLAKEAKATWGAIENEINKFNAPKKEHFWQTGRKSSAQFEKMMDQYDVLESKATAAESLAKNRAAHAGSFTNAAKDGIESKGALQSLWNAPRHVGRFFGYIIGGLSEKTVHGLSEVPAKAKDVAVVIKNGAVKGAEVVHQAAQGASQAIQGADEVVNAASGASGASAFGKFVAEKLPWLAPASAGIKVVTAEDATSATLHGSEAVGLGLGIVKLGAARTVPYLAPVMSTVQGIDAAAHGDNGGMVKAGAELGTIGSFAAAGAGIGVWGAGVGAIPGALVGATVGGIVSIFTGSAAEDAYKEKQAAEAKAVSAPITEEPANQAAALSTEELAAAHAGVIAQARMATAAGRTGAKKAGLVNFNLGTQFASVNQTSIGALTRPEASASTPKATSAEISQPA